MDRWKVDAYRAIATSAVREAKNGGTLVERARREAGIELETIEGIEEARLIQLAVTRRLPLDDKRALLVDVGGGSTELTLVDHGETAFTMSLPLGTVRMLEAYLKGVKTVDRARERLLEEAIDRALGEAAAPARQRSTSLIGTGGNVDTLCDLCPAKGTPRGIDVAAAKALFKKMCAMSNSERRDTYAAPARPRRHDRPRDRDLPAARLRCSRSATILSPGVGLAAGMLEELVDKFFHVWDAAGEAERVLEACARLGRRYHFDEAHARHVCRFASQLFDDLQLVHAFGERDRLLLRAAAMLHDIGDYVHYSGHHKHSQYLIQHADIMGLTPDERAIVANIARYHRKGPPDASHPGYRELDKEARGKVRGLVGHPAHRRRARPRAQAEDRERARRDGPRRGPRHAVPPRRGRPRARGVGGPREGVRSGATSTTSTSRSPRPRWGREAEARASPASRPPSASSLLVASPACAARGAGRSRARPRARTARRPRGETRARSTR